MKTAMTGCKMYISAWQSNRVTRCQVARKWDAASRIRWSSYSMV